MSIKKKLLAVVAVSAVLLFSSSAMANEAAEPMAEPEAELVAEPEAEPTPEPVAMPAVEPVSEPVAAPAIAAVEPVKPKAGPEVTFYGNAQYRLRMNITSRSDEDNSATVMDYANRIGWRLGLKAKVDDQLSMQFQLGNDWSATEAVNWNANNGPRSRFLGVSLIKDKDENITGAALSGYQNLYVHLAYARWNLGFMFIEAGVVPLNDNGTLALLESSLTSGTYREAGFNGWGDLNSSMIGLKVGVPVAKDGVKINAELFQTVITERVPGWPAPLDADVKSNPTAVMMVFTLPVDVGAFKITPEFTGVINRNYSSAEEKGDHEILGGLAGSYKINDGVSVNFNGGYGMLNNENTAGKATFENNGLLVGAGSSIKAGPGTIQIAANYNSSKNTVNEAAEKAQNFDYVYTDLRYVWKAHNNFTITPRYRTYTTLYPEDNALNMQFRNRLELMFEGSF